MAVKTKSLQYRAHELANVSTQLEILGNCNGHPRFEDKIVELGYEKLRPTEIEIMQINVGKMCNQTCKHCHVDAGPDRKEIMSKTTMRHCLDVLSRTNVKTVDITGGAPEMNPDFRWFVEQLSALGKHIIVRCNLTIILANPKYHDLPEFYKKNGVEVVCSLPYFAARRTDSQRGEGVFEKSIKALKLLNEVGYGIPNSELTLNLVYNPTGSFLPSNQSGLELEFKKKLNEGYGIEFNSLYAITNIPVSRYLEYLVASGNFHSYMDKLVSAFNPSAAEGVMCRNTISVGWDGFLYDCDFNQMLDLKVNENTSNHIKNFNLEALTKRAIIVNQHCYGCTAGAGSSCGGELA